MVQEKIGISKSLIFPPTRSLGKLEKSKEDCMKARSVFVLGIVFLFGTMAFAQDYDHKVEVTGE